MVRSLDCGSRRWGFESPRPPHYLPLFAKIVSTTISQPDMADNSTLKEDQMRKGFVSVIIMAVAIVGLTLTAYAGGYSDNAAKKIAELQELEKNKKDMPETLEGVTVINAEKAKALQAAGAKVLDNRVKPQVDTGKIAGAEWFFCDDLLKNPSMADKLDKEKEYVLYCNGIKCWRSPAVAVMLHDLGFKK